MDENKKPRDAADWRQGSQFVARKGPERAARKKQWVKAIAALVVGIAVGGWLNGQAKNFYVPLYLSFAGKDGVLLLGTITSVCFYIPAIIAYRKLRPPAKRNPQKQNKL